jgi:hypothetical protein
MSKFTFNGYENLSNNEIMYHTECIINIIRKKAQNGNFEDEHFDEYYNGVLWVEKELELFQLIYKKFRSDGNPEPRWLECNDIDEVSDLLYQQSNCYIYFCSWFLHIGGNANPGFQEWCKKNFLSTDKY